MTIFLNRIILFTILLGGFMQDIPFDLNRVITGQQIDNCKKSNERNQEFEQVNDGLIARKTSSRYFFNQLQHTTSVAIWPIAVPAEIFNTYFITSIAKQAPCYGQLFLQMLF